MRSVSGKNMCQQFFSSHSNLKKEAIRYLNKQKTFLQIIRFILVEINSYHIWSSNYYKKFISFDEKWIDTVGGHFCRMLYFVNYAVCDVVWEKLYIS